MNTMEKRAHARAQWSVIPFKCSVNRISYLHLFWAAMTTFTLTHTRTHTIGHRNIDGVAVIGDNVATDAEQASNFKQQTLIITINYAKKNIKISKFVYCFQTCAVCTLFSCDFSCENWYADRSAWINAKIVGPAARAKYIAQLKNTVQMLIIFIHSSGG